VGCSTRLINQRKEGASDVDSRSGRHQLYSGVGADIVMESISLIDPEEGEERAQACEIGLVSTLRARMDLRKAMRYRMVRIL
jgi:hypothetical protein